MPLTTQQYEKICVVKLGGDLAGEEPAALTQAVDDAVNNDHLADFIIDFEACGLCDSAGLEALVSVKHRCDALFGRMKLINLDETCQKILEITRLLPRFEVARDLPSAMKTMR